MNFQKGYIYHIYNQGNNLRAIFFGRDNYLYFLEKIKTYVYPYANIFAWCLMPNHFHLMVLINDVELDCQGLTSSQLDSQGLTQSHLDSQGLTSSQTLTGKHRTFNDSIGILLRSYTRAINKQKGFSGTLFRKETKAECVNCPNGVTPSFFTESGITRINIQNPEKQYPQVCFNYIHQNPVKAKLVNSAIDWEFSSVRDYAGLRDGKLVNKKVAGEYINLTQSQGLSRSYKSGLESKVRA